MRIAVMDAVDCTGVALERHDWIPMDVTWEPWPDNRPLYLRISGTNGGEVELKVAPGHRDAGTGNRYHHASTDHGNPLNSF